MYIAIHVPWIFPFVGHRDDIGVIEVRPLAITSLPAFLRRRWVSGVTDRPAKSQLPCWQVIVQIQAGPVLRIQRDIAERPTNARQDKPLGSQLFIQRLFTFHLYPAAEQLSGARTATPLSTTRRDQHTVSF